MTGSNAGAAHGVIIRVCASASLAALLLLSSASAQTLLRWGGDAEGGAPFVEADPAIPRSSSASTSRSPELIAGELGRTPQFVQVAFTSLDQSARRGDFDIGLSGIEDIPARRAALAASIPYYQFREVLTVREADRGRYRIAADLRGRRVATLGGTMAYDLLLAGRARPRHRSPSPTTTTCIRTRIWPIGRVDAVLLDNVLAERAMRRQRRPVTRIPTPSPSGTTSSSRAGEHGACAIGSTRSCARRCSDGTARSASSGTGRSGTRTSRSSTPARADCRDRSDAPAGRRHAGRVDSADRDAALPAVAAARRRRHAGAVVCWRWCWPWRSGVADRHRARLRRAVDSRRCSPPTSR